MKKIAFFDLDGTLINVPTGLTGPSPQTTRVLKAFQAQGHLIVAATARGSLPESFKNIHFDGEIYSDGHYIAFGDKVLLDNVFSAAQIKQQLEIYRQHGGEAIFGGFHGGWVSTHTNKYVAHHSHLFSGSDDLTTIPLVTDDRLETVKANTVAAVFPTAEDLLAAKEKLPTDWQIHAYTDPASSIRMDVHLPGHTKGSACEFLYQTLGFAKENTLAFGDGPNDVEMLQLVGLGIAMANGPEYVQKIADEVTATVDEDGVAKALKKHFDL